MVSRDRRRTDRHVSPRRRPFSHRPIRFVNENVASPSGDAGSFLRRFIALSICRRCALARLRQRLRPLTRAIGVVAGPVLNWLLGRSASPPLRTWRSSSAAMWQGSVGQSTAARSRRTVLRPDGDCSLQTSTSAPEPQSVGVGADNPGLYFGHVANSGRAPKLAAY